MLAVTWQSFASYYVHQSHALSLLKFCSSFVLMETEIPGKHPATGDLSGRVLSTLLHENLPR